MKEIDVLQTRRQQSALRWPGACEVRVDSCQYGSIHLKSFALLGINLDLPSIARRCQGQCQHVTVQGVYTKASAIYTPELAAALAWAFKHSISCIKHLRAEDSGIKFDGLENQLVNEIMESNDWQVKKCWRFKKESHINLLELKAVQKLVEDRARSGPSRFLGLVDSNVSRCALGKGRSASKSISTILRRIGATLVAYDLYLVTPFCPTRLNCADDPTRQRPLRTSSPGLGWRDLSNEVLWQLAEVRPTRRWASNWLRLTLLLGGLDLLGLHDRSVYRLQHSSRSPLFGPSGEALSCPYFNYQGLDFDSTLDFLVRVPAPAYFCSAVFFSLLECLAPSLYFSLLSLAGVLVCRGACLRFMPLT